ncbi:MAG: sigma-70 family RNA polymerase sigma factor [Akkermansiaceae bacterium]|nr:sigma-70 family RNA polymerase sigma factor [Akkermansiaceae bacterium]
MADEFLTTRWSLVLAAAHGEGSGAAAAMENLCRDVWRPLYAYARRWGCSQQDAEDAVQGFIASLLSHQSLTRVGSEKGRFRSFLLGGMKHHLIDLADRNRAAKRGGGQALISLDATDAEQSYLSLAAETDSPERAFDRVWALDIMQRAKQRLGEECQASGKAAVFQAFFQDSSSQVAEDYAGLSERLNMSVTALRTLSMRLRRRWKELIRAELAQQVTSNDALDEELNCLRAALLD